MKQILYSPADGEISVAEVPTPAAGPGRVLVRTGASLVSAGTDRMALDFARRSFCEKAQARPDLLQQVVAKAHRDGWLAAFRSARNRLDRPVPLGYSSAGTVLEAGPGVTDLKLGDHVACAGAGYATHAEIVSVPRNLVAKIPKAQDPRHEPIDFEEAAFATMGAIGMHGLRLAEVQFGESVAVIGLGIVGLLTVQLARVAGCAVFGMDPDLERCRLALKLGCAACATASSDLETLISSQTESIGVDAVILAAATPSDSPVRLAAAVSRQRGRVIAVGAVGTNIPRDLYYKKELNFRVSRSYGPGRYDREYEERGHDYPVEYVRWTENRNLKLFLALLARGQVDVRPLISHSMAISEARTAYDLISGTGRERFLGVVFTYGERMSVSRRVDHAPRNEGTTWLASDARVKIGLLGAGNFALGLLIPAICKANNSKRVGVCSFSGASAYYAAKKFQFRYSTTDENEIFADSEIDTVVIATPHKFHGQQVLRALAARKHIFCEKPLCLSENELSRIASVYREFDDPKPHLMVGFNRRYSPMARALKEALNHRDGQPLVMHYRVNAGPLPAHGWMRDEDQGGRILGEVCHFVDLLIFLAGSGPVRVCARSPVCGTVRNDSTVVSLEFPDGSIGTITYAANGDRSFSKERLEVFCGGLTGVIEDFRRLEIVQDGRTGKMVSRFFQDKGHRSEWEAFVGGLKGERPPACFEETLATTLVTFRIQDSLRLAQPVELGLQEFIAPRGKSANETQPVYTPLAEDGGEQPC
jgi:predicted dehydrogenase